MPLFEFETRVRTNTHVWKTRKWETRDKKISFCKDSHPVPQHTITLSQMGKFLNGFVEFLNWPSANGILFDNFFHKCFTNTTDHLRRVCMVKQCSIDRDIRPGITKTKTAFGSHYIRFGIPQCLFESSVHSLTPTLTTRCMYTDPDRWFHKMADIQNKGLPSTLPR